MKLEKKRNRLLFCCRFIAGATLGGAIIGVSARLLKFDEDFLMSTSWGPPISIVFGFAYLTCFFGMIKYLYDLDPGIQLRGKTKQQLEDILVDERYKIWHARAVQLIKEKESETCRSRQ